MDMQTGHEDVVGGEECVSVWSVRFLDANRSRCVQQNGPDVCLYCASPLYLPIAPDWEAREEQGGLREEIVTVCSTRGQLVSTHCSTAGAVW